MGRRQVLLVTAGATATDRASGLLRVSSESAEETRDCNKPTKISPPLAPPLGGTAVTCSPSFARARPPPRGDDVRAERAPRVRGVNEALWGMPLPGQPLPRRWKVRSDPPAPPDSKDRGPPLGLPQKGCSAPSVQYGMLRLRSLPATAGPFPPPEAPHSERSPGRASERALEWAHRMRVPDPGRIGSSLVLEPYTCSESLPLPCQVCHESPPLRW